MIGGLVLVFLSVWWVFWHGRVSTDNAYVKADITLLAPKVAGYVKAVHIVDNQPVKAGDLLVEIDDADYVAKLASANARRDALVGQLAAQGQQIAEANAAAVKAGRDYTRLKALVGEGAVSARQMDEAVAAAKSAQAALEAAKLQVDVLTAQMKQAAADADLAAMDVSNTQIRAPQDGTIGNRSVQVGQLVRSGSALAYLIPPKMWVEANFKETQLPGMKPGQPARVSVDALPGADLHGRVDSLAPASGAEFSILPPENATGNFTKVVRRVPVKIVLTDPAPALARLRPGLSTVVTVDTR